MLDSPKEIEFLSESQRRRSTVLLVEENLQLRQRMREFLRSLGYGSISEVSDLSNALKKLKERNFTYVLFATEHTGIDLEGFLKHALKLDQSTIPIAVSKKADGEKIFELLQLGAKSCLVHPITQEKIDAAIGMATNGKPIPDSILHASDRNQALASMLSQSIDNAALALKRERDRQVPNSEIPGLMEILRRSAKVAKTFAKGGAASLLQSIEQVFIKKGEGSSTRLGRVRAQLRERRAKEKNKG